MTNVIDHQDAAGMAGAPLGAFIDGIRVGTVADHSTDPFGEHLARRMRAAHQGAHVEILLTCPGHPHVAAVDCLDCAPEDE